LIQFAIGSRVEPRYSESVRITERFRSRVLGRFAEQVAGARLKRGLADASTDVKQKATLLSGKDEQGKALAGHRHTFFFLHGEPSKPTRLCLWRQEPFTDEEQQAILSAASHPLPLSYHDDPWTITLVPLDSMVPPPAGFSAQPSHSWKTLTPWVPPRHALDRKGRVKPGHSLEEQLHEELASCGVPAIETISIHKAGWVKFHQPSKSRDGRTNTNKLGYDIHLSFESPFSGPLIVGHSSHFGLGLFVPAD
jgi:CRISPR-associated protein Csb2